MTVCLEPKSYKGNKVLKFPQGFGVRWLAGNGANTAFKRGALREKFGKYSRKECWKLTNAIIDGRITFRAVLAQFNKAGEAEKLWE